LSPEPELNFLVSSAGRRGELVEILRETISFLGRCGGVYCVDRSHMSAAGRIADGLDIVPSIEDPSFVDAVLRVCAARRISHLIPTIDTELLVYAQNRKAFEDAGVHVWVSSPRVIQIAQDKRLTNQWLTEHDFPAPDQLDVATALQTPDLTYPVIAKPAHGSSSIGLVRIDDRARLETHSPRADYVVEQVASGDEFTVDVWVDNNGVCRAAVPRRRIEVRAGEVSKGVTVRDESLMALATDVVSALPGARGVLNVQVFSDADRGVQQVIEINARFGGGFPLSWAAGARMPVWGVHEFEGTGPTQPELSQWTSGLVMLRYDQGVYVTEDDA
jgi:carbamoyl-phosphate synthase large subunit